jgi:hypothetical protein
MTKQKISGISGRAAGKPRIGIKNKAAPKYMAEVEIRTAHDVRKLAGCAYCKGMGDKNHMIPLGSGRAMEHVHGRCYAAVDGLPAILALPKEITDHLTISDIGGKVMKALLEKHYGH